MAVVMYFAPAVLLADATAHAAPIVDPRAPIPFQPTITQTSTGIPTVNITAPNSNGLSLNSYQSFNIDSRGLVLNNSLTGGTPLLGGTLGANPNLAGRTATTIINQVTSTGPASSLLGPLEVFGNPATVIISNPNGISVNGMALTNMPGLVLTTGTVQFLTGIGGTSTGFTNAGALAYSVNSGNISINGPPGENGPGAGIAGTVGNIDIIGQTINVNAPLQADSRVNLIAGNQLATPTASDSTGTTYGTTSNGTINTAAAIGNGGLAIDANQFGSVTSGQVFIVSTAAGMGVNTQGALSATAGNVVVSANGDIDVGSTYAKQSATLISAGNVSISGNGLASQYTVNAAGDISAAGATVQSVQDLNMTAGGSLSVGSARSNGNVNLTAGGDMSVGSVATGDSLTLTTTGKSGNGDLTVGGAVSAPGAVALNAARDITVNGAVTGGSSVQLNAQRNASINGQALSGGTLSLSGTTGNVSTSGSVLANGDLSAVAGQAMTLGGNVSTSGNTLLTAGTDLTISGNVSGNGSGSLGAGGNLSGSGSASFGQDATLSAAQAIDLSGSVQTGGNLSAAAGSSLTVGAATAVGDATLKASGGDASINGAVLAGGNLVAQATGNLTVAGSTTSLGTTTLTAQSGNLSAQGDLKSTGDASLSAAQTLVVTGNTQVGGNATLSGANITTGGTTTVSGTLNAAAQNTLDLSAGQLNVVRDATLTGTNVSTGGALIGGNFTANASNQLTTGGSQTLVQGAAALTGTNGVTNTSSVLAGGPLTVTGANVTNGAGANLISTAATTVNAVNLNNAGAIAGLTTAVTASGALTNNNGAIVGTNLLNVTTGNLAGNQNGVLFAGSTDPSSPATPGDATITVTGGSGTFNNAGGQIAAQHDLTLNLQNQAFDPSAATSGTINLGNALTINTQQLNNSGTWAMPGNSVSINAAQGFSNSGTISKAGDITLSTNGTLTNSGTISAGNDVNLSGTIVNQAGGTIAANEDVNLTGVTTNAGTVSAVRDVNLNGSSFDNSGATTRAGRDLNANLSGDLTNVGGTMTAQNDVTINAANVNNSQAGSNTTTTTTTTTTVAAAGLGSALLSAPMGSETYTLQSTNQVSDITSTFTGVITGRVGDLQPTGAATITAPDLSSGTLYGVALPDVTQTTTTTQPSGAAGVIAAGHDLSITTGALNNHGGMLSAGNNVTLKVASLDNGGDAAVTTITDSIDAASYASFLTQLKAAYQAGTLEVALDTVDALDNSYNTPLVGQANIITSTPAPILQTSTLTTYTSQNAGQIVAGNNLSLTGTGASLTNAGNLYAGQDLLITANNFTNQGYHTSNVTSSTGCVAGVAVGQCGYFGTMLTSDFEEIMYERPGQDFTDAMTNSAVAAYLVSGYSVPFGPHNDAANIFGDQTSTQSYSYTQTNNTVFAGRDLVIAAPVVNNTYGNLLAGRDVVIGGAGTTRDNTNPTTPQTNLTQSSALTNTSGNIQAGRDIAISTAALTNTVSAPAQVYQNYGQTAQFGCSGAFVHYCDAFVDVQSGDVSTITANRNLSINAGSVTNTGSLITAGSAATVTATSTITNQDQTLNAYWHDAYWAPVLGSSKPPDNFGCGTAANCATLFGSAYQSGAGIQPPTPYASLPGTIQAPSLSVSAGGQVQNSGNVMGQQVAITGASLVNGLTSPAIYTPQPTGSQQVISLGPVGTPVAATNAANQAGNLGLMGAGLGAASGIGSAIAGGSGAALSSAANAGSGGGAVSVPGSPSVQTPAGVSHSATYLVSSPASQVMGDIGGAQLLAALPASLQPSTTQFYYDPFTEDQVLQQAALAQTGQASFVSGLAYDNQNQTSVANQEKQVLYGNAIQYAEANNLALGTPLSQSQIASLDAPMLWYVEETVPEPGCTATGNAACPTVQALMPQVYLPQNYAVVEHDGTITGQNVTLTATNGGAITNTGSIAATDTLSVNAGTLTNEERSTDIGTQYDFISSIDGLLTTTGTVTQQGGFMSAGNYQMNVDAVNQIGGALQKLNADGTVDAAGTQQELANLKAQLGNSFVQGAVSDDLTTTFTSLAESPGLFQQIGMLAVMVVASVMTAGAASAAIGAGATAGSTFAAGTAATTTAEGVFMPAVSAGLGNMALSAGVAAMTGNALGQAANGSFDLGSMVEAGATAMLTVGLTNGITVGGQSLASLAGVQSVGDALIPQAGATTAGTILQQGEAIAAEATVQAGVQTAIEGGSFLTNLEHSAVSDVAAAGAYAIGNAFSDQSGFWTTSNPLYAAEHAALGCAASAALGTGCAGGAIGGAISAGLNPVIDANGNIPPAALAGIETLVSGSVAGALGFNVQGAVTAAQNETLNNWLNHVTLVGEQSQAQRLQSAMSGCDSGDAAACATAAKLMQTSSANDQALATACQSPGSLACAYQKSLASLAGNNLSVVNGVTVATDAPQPTYTAPSQAAATLDNMLGSPLAGIMGGAAYLSGGSTQTAYYLSSLGVAADGIAAGVAGFGASKTVDVVSEAANTSTQTPFQRGIQFQGDALSALGVPENTQRITVSLPNGSPVTVVPDALDGSTIVEVKDVVNLSNSNQFRGYLATGNPIQLIVSPNTKTISQPLQNLITNSGGTIRVFNSSTGTFSPWTTK
ncbi:beta strand repeat-containing protein [Paraburkholderia antibiotica]|nr:filamentous hemagglutinin N-terminal domain-containing protein [Paraburkholderia antibiotica]